MGGDDDPWWLFWLKMDESRWREKEMVGNPRLEREISDLMLLGCFSWWRERERERERERGWW